MRQKMGGPRAEKDGTLHSLILRSMEHWLSGATRLGFMCPVRTSPAYSLPHRVDGMKNES